MPLTQVQSGMMDSVAQYNGFKNRLINGAMVIDQRNNGASGTAVAFTVDRWGYYATQASKGTWQQNAGAVTPPAGYKNYWGFTSSSAYSALAGDLFELYQFIEGLNTYDLNWGTASAHTVTISFWVRSSLTGTFSGALLNSAQNRSYAFTYTISTANTWEQKSITIAGDTTGTWLTTNATGIGLVFSLGVGTTYSTTAGSWVAGTYIGATGSVNVVGTNGATWYVTGVQFEKGSTATAFDYRPYGTELQLCQRYCVQWNGTAIPYVTGQVNSATVLYSTIPYAMRTTPTAAFLSLNANDAGVANPVLSIIGLNMGGSGGGFYATSTGLTVGRCGIIYGTGASSYLRFDAEL
jgi:hypothetical protein